MGVGGFCKDIFSKPTRTELQLSIVGRSNEKIIADASFLCDSSLGSRWLFRVQSSNWLSSITASTLFLDWLGIKICTLTFLTVDFQRETKNEQEWKIEIFVSEWKARVSYISLKYSRRLISNQITILFFHEETFFLFLCKRQLGKSMIQKYKDRLEYCC